MSPRHHPRRKSLNVPGQAHELTFTCYHRFKFLNSDRTCHWLAQAINDAAQKHDYAVWAYVFMPEHVHLLVYPRQMTYNISRLLTAIKEPVGRRAIKYLEQHAPDWLARVTRQRGQRIERLFWQTGGGYDRNFYESQRIFDSMNYLHNNPVRRGLVANTVDWRWSSAAWHASQTPSPVQIDPIISL